MSIKKNKNKISAIIITKDRPHYLKKSIESIKKQSSKVTEIIVVDNGKKKNKYNFKNIKFIKTSHAIGAAKARNIGVKNSKCQFLAFLDDDDIWGSDYIKNSKKFLSKDVILLGKIYSLDRKKIIKQKSKKFNNKNSALNNLYIRNPGIVGSNIIIPKNVYKEVGGFDTRLPLGQDKAIAIEAKKLGYSLLRTDAKIYFRENTIGERNTSLLKYFIGKILFFQKYKTNMNLITIFLYFSFFLKNLFYIVYKNFKN